MLSLELRIYFKVSTYTLFLKRPFRSYGWRQGTLWRQTAWVRKWGFGSATNVAKHSQARVDLINTSNITQENIHTFVVYAEKGIIMGTIISSIWEDMRVVVIHVNFVGKYLKLYRQSSITSQNILEGIDLSATSVIKDLISRVKMKSTLRVISCKGKNGIFLFCFSLNVMLSCVSFNIYYTNRTNHSQMKHLCYIFQLHHFVW